MSFHRRPSPRCTRSATRRCRGAHPREELETLEGAADAEPGPLVDRQPVDAPALQADLPRVATADTVQAVEKRRLAGAVRAHEADRLTGIDGDRDIVQGDDAAEALGNPGAFDKGHVS